MPMEQQKQTHCSPLGHDRQEAALRQPEPYYLWQAFVHREGSLSNLVRLPPSSCPVAGENASRSKVLLSWHVQATEQMHELQGLFAVFNSRIAYALKSSQRESKLLLLGWLW